ncbi:site-specific integrase [Plebeiibacterium sediminum]|uniref:Site-specific integrase n=1 Tax=Plebeiibacterium sediminum TaxID=2992112 RepID=A0AAE3SG24_9BACT|nr:site-specific integrase [Plebeiobacterium sediminum]MCW3786843.1 site-specific integrase [Plebeiobacterium sediminum]
MAQIKFMARGNTDQKEIYIRLTAGREVNLKRKTGYTIDKSLWKFTTATKGANKGKLTEFGVPKQTDAISKKLKEQLDSLSTEINKRFNDCTEKGIVIDGVWLENQIREIQNRPTDEERDRSDLLTFTQSYIDYLPYHIQKNGKRGVSKNTIQKFVTLKARLTDFQKSKKKKYNIVDVSPEFVNQFDIYLRGKGYSDNYIGTLSINLKTMCKKARKDGLKVNSNLDDITGVKDDSVEKIILSFKELETIKNTDYVREALANARDWLIIGCYTGQRVSDLLKLTKKNIVFKSGLELIELTQIKTGKRVTLPIHPEVKEILDKNDGNFPYKISDVKFNVYIKDVCELAKIDQPTAGAIMKEVEVNGKKEFRKISGVYPKYELITSHCMRRSFATNHYGDIPTPIIMSATGHATEKKFLIYIGKTATEQAQQLAEYWTKAAMMNKKESNLKIIKKAN